MQYLQCSIVCMLDSWWLGENICMYIVLLCISWKKYANNGDSEKTQQQKTPVEVTAKREKTNQLVAPQDNGLQDNGLILTNTKKSPKNWKFTPLGGAPENLPSHLQICALLDGAVVTFPLFFSLSLFLYSSFPSILLSLPSFSPFPHVGKNRPQLSRMGASIELVLFQFINI